MNNLKEIIKATLFVAGDGVDKDEILSKLEIDKKTLEKAVNELKDEFCGDNGIHIIEYKNKIQLCSNPNYAEQISVVLNPIREKALTKAALETVAIIAYKQPITKLEIEEIRKINSADYAIQVLLDNKMIEIVGRKDAVGKPYMFGTTDEFLKRFNLKNLEDLPDYEQLLERIDVIRSETYDNQLSSDGLYRDYDVPEEEEIPDFLKNEQDIKQIKAEDQEMLDRVDEVLKANNIQKMDFTPKDEQNDAVWLHKNLIYTNNSDMESLYLAIPLFFIVLVIVYMQIKVNVEVNALAGYVLLVISLFNIKIIKIKLVYNNNKIYYFLNKKEKEINIQLSVGQVYFINQFVANIKDKTMLKYLDVNAKIGTMDAYSTAMQCGTMIALSKTLFAYLKTKKYTATLSTFIEPKFNQNIFLIKIDLCVKITLYDLLYSLIVSLVSLKRRAYERNKQ